MMALGAHCSQHVTSSVISASLTSCTVLIEQLLVSFAPRNKLDLELNRNECGGICRREGVA